MQPRRWLPFLGGLLIAGLLLKVSWLVALSVALSVVIGLAWLWQTQSLKNVHYRRRFHYTRAFPGEQVTVRIEAENDKLLPLSWLRVQDPWQKAIGPTDENILAPSHLPDQGILTNVFSLRWFERARRTYTLTFRKRGVYVVGPARLESGDLFGLYESGAELPNTELLTVFPPLLPMRALNLPAEDPLGDLRSRRRLFEDPNRPMGVREYHPEDSFRRVHWGATARTGRLQVKVFQPTAGQVMVACLNVSTFARHWEGVDPPALEYLVSVTATLLNHTIESGYKAGLIANGCIARSDQPFRIPPGRTSRQLAILLGALAGVNPVVTMPFERFLLREMPRLPYGASLAIITAIHTPQLLETLLKLKKHERRITLISLAAQPPEETLPGIQVVHLPIKPA